MSQYVVNGRSMKVAGRELLRSALLDPFLANAGLVLSLSVILTVSDAFETESLQMLHSVALWLVVSMLMVLQTCLTHRLFLAFASRTALSRLFAAGLSLLATVLLVAAELHWLKYTPLLPKEPDPFFDFVFFVAQPVFAAWCLTLLSQTHTIQRYVDLLQARNRLESESRVEPIELDSLLRRHEVLSVSAQDHYLEIVCVDRKFLLRGRLRDALLSLTHCEGVQVHRSHWVAYNHVRQVRRSGRDLKLVLEDGRELPVARSRSQRVSQLFESLTEEPYR